jgi:hypothetical protein
MPCLNRIAAESMVFDQHFGEDFSAKPEGQAFWSGCSHFPRQGTQLLAEVPLLPNVLTKGNVATDWLTETADPEIVPLPNSTDFRVLPSFSDLIQRGCGVLEKRRHASESRQLLWLKVGGKTWDGLSLGKWGSDENEAASSHLDRLIEPLWLALLNLAKSRRVLFLLTAARGLSLKDCAGTLESEQAWTEEFVHLPLVVWHSEIDGGERRAEFTQPMDVPATLLDFFAIEPQQAWEGRSVLPWILGPGGSGRDVVILGSGGSWASIRNRGFHLVRIADRNHPDGFHRLLFVKPDDVWDRHDVSPQEPDVTEGLSRQLDAFLSAAKTRIPIIDQNHISKETEGSAAPA